MTKKIQLVLFMLLSLVAFNTYASEVSLNSIDFASLPGEKVKITLKFNGDVPEPGTFTIDTPARIALDFPGVKSALAQNKKTIGIGLTNSINVAEAGGRTRVIINMVSLSPYTTRVDGDEVTVVLDSSGQGGSSNFMAEKSVIKEVDFKRGDDGEGNIIIRFSGPVDAADLKKEGGKLVLDITGAMLPGRLERRLDVVDFATPVNSIDTFSSGDRVQLIVDAKQPYEHLAYQTGNEYTVEIRKLSEAEIEERKKTEFGYSGERLSLNFQDIEVRAVLQLIADFTGLNMVTADTVQGSVTLRLKNVPWDQALDIILKTKGLAMRREGNVIRVAPAPEIAAVEKQELEALKAVRELAPLVTERIQINYAKAQDIVNILNQTQKSFAASIDPSSRDINESEARAAAANAPAGAIGSVLSERGSVVFDPRTNSILVRDTTDNLEQIRRLITQLDIPVEQVMIESRIVLATDDFSKQLGLNWVLASEESGIDSEDFPTEYEYTIPGDQNTGVLDVDLGTAQKNVLSLFLGNLPGDYLLGLELSASEAEGLSEVVSSPRVITQNQKEAKIEQGFEIPYTSAAADGGTDVSFKEAVLSLTVTPQITPNDRINMDLEITKDDPLSTVPGVEPPIATQSVETSVLVDNGETVVIGGIFERELTTNQDGVPVIKDIPLLGALFRVDSVVDTKTELLIFITPKLIDDNLKFK